jgi:hypothetical protein
VREADAEPAAEAVYDDMSQTKHARVLGPGGLGVEVSWETMTGQTHVATELAIATPGGTLKPEEDEQGLPLLERVFQAGPHGWILLGWSSHGEGFQSEHVWLVEDDGGAPRVVDRLVWTSDRMHAGLALDPTKLRVGIPLPVGDLHAATDWELHHGKQKLSLEQLAHQAAPATNVMTLPGYYDPPNDDEPSTMHWSGRIVWFVAKPGRFAQE